MMREALKLIQDVNILDLYNSTVLEYNRIVKKLKKKFQRRILIEEIFVNVKFWFLDLRVSY